MLDLGKFLGSPTITSGLVAAAASALVTWGNMSSSIKAIEDRTTKLESKQDDLNQKQENIAEKLVAIDVSLGYIREYIVGKAPSPQGHNQGIFHESPEK